MEAQMLLKPIIETFTINIYVHQGLHSQLDRAHCKLEQFI